MPRRKARASSRSGEQTSSWFCAGYWSAGDLTCWNPGGMTTSVLAMLAALGRSHWMLVTDVYE
jgi:hypothetical protein